MARFLFLQDIRFEFFGPMYLSAMLKKHGHEVCLCCGESYRDTFRRISSWNPDVLCLSCMTGPHRSQVILAGKLRHALNVPVFMGGPHATFFPDVLADSSLDYICRGEGEEVIVEFAHALDTHNDPTGIANIGYKQNNQCVYNPPRPLIDNLDTLPFPDRDLYYSPIPALRKYPTKRFLTSRGCPYGCTFCFNHAYKELYSKAKRYVRHRSPENVVEEICAVQSRYPLTSVRFPDDSFTLNRQWLHDFLLLYRKEVKLPFTCLARANELAHEEVVQWLKEAGCSNLFFGIEVGDEQYRNKVMRKGLTDNHIVQSAEHLHKYGIVFGTYNMVGLPGETLDDCLKTIRLNRRIRAPLPSSTIFQPYPGTTLAAYAQEKGLLAPDYSVDDFSGMLKKSLLTGQSREIINLNSFFFLAVKAPFLVPFIRMLIKLPPNPLFRFIAFCSLGIARIKAQDIGIIDAVRIAVSFFKRV